MGREKNRFEFAFGVQSMLVWLNCLEKLIHTCDFNLKALTTTGAFCFFNDGQSAQNTFQYLAPSPASTADIETLFLPK